ncbi:hypothetical protein K2Y11_14660 [bacterium]|nr:hypothetical protein [bacterium]
MEQLRNLAEWYQKNKALLNTLGSFLLVILGAIYALSLQSEKLLFQSSIIVNWFLLLISLFAIIGGVVVFSWLFRNLNPWGYSRFN